MEDNIQKITGKKPLKKPPLMILKNDCLESTQTMNGDTERLEESSSEDRRGPLDKQGRHTWCDISSAILGPHGGAAGRTLHSLFPMVECFLISEDDLTGVTRGEHEEMIITAVILALCEMGAPMAWHKIHINEESLWIGPFS